MTILFVTASFFLLIHLLNMLIAIMGETFSENNETKDIQQTRSHLSFVLQNWYMDAIPDKDKARYLISALLREEDSEQTEILENINKQFTALNKKID